MKVLFLIGGHNLGINFVMKKIKSIPGVKVNCIEVKRKSLNLQGKIIHLIKTAIVFYYSRNFKLLDFFLSLSSINKLKVEHVNSIQVNNLIEDKKPDILVISGTKKVDAKFLEKIKIKINLHHGIVPFYRGVSSVNWVLQEMDFGNFGITIHEATEVLDAGKVLLCEKIYPFKGEPLRLFMLRLYLEGCDYLLQGIESILNENEQWYEQDNSYSRNLKHSDKPKGFGQLENRERAFDMYSNLNGYNNVFFYLRSKLTSKVKQPILSQGWYVLNYHSFNSDKEIQKYKSLGYPSIFTTLVNFKKHLDFMEENGTLISIQEGLDMWKSQLLNGVFFSVTIDDGLKSSIPAIQEMNNRGVIPTLFINGSPCLDKYTKLSNHPHINKIENKDNKFYFSDSELRLLSKDKILNFEIGTHTHNHKNLSNLDKFEIEKEIIFSHRALETALEKEIPYFSFPFGKLDARNYLSDLASRQLKTTNFECYGGVNKIYRQHFNVLRVGIHNETREEFSALITRQWVR